MNPRRGQAQPGELASVRMTLVNALVKRVLFSRLVNSGMVGGQCRRCQRPYLSRNDRGLCPPCDPGKPTVAEDNISREGWLSRDWSIASQPAGGDS